MLAHQIISKIILASLFFGILPAWGAGPSPVTLPISTGTVKFLAKGKPSAIRIHGTGQPIQGSVQLTGLDVKGNFDIAIDALDTGIALRTSHMKETYLEMKKFPKALFQLNEMKLPSTLKSNGYSAENIPLSGVLTLHGVQHSLSGIAALRSEEGKLTAHISFPVLLSSHGITIPTYLGVTVTDQVEVDVDLNAQLPN